MPEESKAESRRSPAKSGARGRSPPAKEIAMQPLSGKMYLFVSIVLIGASAAGALFILNYVNKNGETSVTDLAYYLTVLILGLAAASFLFGVMNSYASYTGKTHSRLS
jgi:hypothetical protein